MSSTDVARDTAISLRQAIQMQNAKAIELWLDVVDDPAERAYQLSRLSSADRHRLGEMLTPDVAPKLLDAVDVHLAARIIKAQASARAAELLTALDPQHAVRILRRYQPDLRDSLLTAMPIEQAKTLRSMLLWRPDSVAAHMSTETLAVGPTTTAEEAVAQIRDRISEQRTEGHAGNCVYVADPEGQLLGAVPFRSLVLAKADRVVTDLMEDDVVTVGPLTEAEEAAHLCVNRRLEELAVVDGDRRLLGILTEDQAVDIIQDETTEDAEKQGGSTPLEVPYLRASPWRLWRKRIVWLLVLFVAEAYTGTVLRAFEDEMEAVVALAFFIPLLIGTGGNTGTQITTTLVRAMGTGQVRLRDLPAVVAKELSTGTLIAVAMALAAMIRAMDPRRRAADHADRVADRRRHRDVVGVGVVDPAARAQEDPHRSRGGVRADDRHHRGRHRSDDLLRHRPPDAAPAGRSLTRGFGIAAGLATVVACSGCSFSAAATGSDQDRLPVAGGRDAPVESLFTPGANREQPDFPRTFRRRLYVGTHHHHAVGRPDTRVSPDGTRSGARRCRSVATAASPKRSRAGARNQAQHRFLSTAPGPTGCSTARHCGVR